MIRHVITVKFKPDATPVNVKFLHDFWEESRTRYKGMLGLTFGPDAGLKDGNWSTVAVFDFVDEEAFRVFDVDAYHNEVRAQLPANGVSRRSAARFGCRLSASRQAGQ